MKAEKQYVGGKVFVYITDDEGYYVGITFDNEQQMRVVGECLKDLARIGGNTVEIKYKEKEK